MRYCVACMEKFEPWSTELSCWKCRPQKAHVPAPKKAKPANLILSDGGKKAAGIKEDNDCTVRALAHALDVSYAEAHAWLRSKGRRDGKGCAFQTILRRSSYMVLGRKLQPDTVHRARGLRTFLARNPKLKRGTWILHSTQHASVIKDGVYFDSFDSTRKTFDAAWFVIGSTKGEE